MGTVTPNRENYSVQEDATSFDPSGPGGGVGQLTYTIQDFPGAHRSLNERVVLDDSGRGRFEAEVRGLSRSNGSLNVTADGALSGFNEWHSIPPYTGTLAGYVNLLTSITGVPNAVFIDPTIPATPVTVPGYRGNVFDNFRMFLAANQWEVSQVYSRIVVRPIRTITAYDVNLISESEDVTIQTTPPVFDINWYQTTWGTQAEFYPPASDDPTVLVVDAGEVVVQEFTVDGSMTTINQPVAQDFVANATYAGTNGVYAVAGNDGIPIPAAQWLAFGGELTVKIMDDPSVLEVTVRGARLEHLSPFRIAMTAGTSSYYNSLRVTGTGALWTKHKMTFNTGEDQVNSDSYTGSEIDNIFIQNPGQAITASLYALKGMVGPSHTLSGSTVALNQPNANSEIVAASIGDFNAVYPGLTIAGFNSLYSGQTIQQFNDYWETVNSNDFSNQLFGQGIGARLIRDTAAFRVTSTTTGPDVVNYDAVSDTTIGDFNGRFTGATIATYNAHYAGQVIRDYNVTPLRPTLAPDIVPPAPSIPYPGSGTYPNTDVFPA